MTQAQQTAQAEDERILRSKAHPSLKLAAWNRYEGRLWLDFLERNPLIRANTLTELERWNIEVVKAR